MPAPISFDPPAAPVRSKLEPLPSSSPFSSPMYSNYQPRFSPHHQSLMLDQHNSQTWTRPNTAPPMSPLALQPQQHLQHAMSHGGISQSPEIGPMSSPFSFQPYHSGNQPRLRQHVLHEDHHNDYASNEAFCRRLPQSLNQPLNQSNNQSNDKLKPMKWNWTTISVTAAVILILINLVLLVYLVTSMRSLSNAQSVRGHSHVDPAHALRDESLMAAVEDYEAHMRMHRREAAQAAQDLTNNQSNNPEIIKEVLHDNLHEGAEPVSHKHE